MSFVPGTDRAQRFPIVTRDEQAQATRDAIELNHTVLCAAECYRIDAGRISRALALLARHWAARQQP